MRAHLQQHNLLVTRAGLGIVDRWTRPYTEEHHVQIVGAYFRFSADGAWEVDVADVSPDGWAGQTDPMVVVVGRKLATAAD